MAYTFIKAQGYEIGLSLCDDEKLDYCKEMMAKAEKMGKKILLPVDAVTIKDFPDPIDGPVETEVCVSHTTTDDKGITLLKQVVDNVEFVCYLSTTEDCYKGC